VSARGDESGKKKKNENVVVKAIGVTSLWKPVEDDNDATSLMSRENEEKNIITAKWKMMTILPHRRIWRRNDDNGMLISSWW